jgi:hypothetical protein
MGDPEGEGMAGPEGEGMDGLEGEDMSPEEMKEAEQEVIQRQIETTEAQLETLGKLDEDGNDMLDEATMKALQVAAGAPGPTQHIPDSRSCQNALMMRDGRAEQTQHSPPQHRRRTHTLHCTGAFHQLPHRPD